jgi:hypothetical protein
MNLRFAIYPETIYPYDVLMEQFIAFPPKEFTTLFFWREIWGRCDNKEKRYEFLQVFKVNFILYENSLHTNQKPLNEVIEDFLNYLNK